MKDRILVGIHQPNFFLFLLYFDKIARVDVFVLLDHVQLQKTGGSWTNRVKLMIAGVPQWVTAPILRFHQAAPSISEVEFDERSPWREKFLKTLDANYRRAPYYRETIDLIEPIILQRIAGTASYNALAIEHISSALSLTGARFVRSSQLAPSGASNELLIILCRMVGGTAYLCGGGASDYQEDAVLLRAGVQVIHQNFVHPIYEQHTRDRTFVPGLSVIDALMHCGREATSKLLLGSH